MPRSSLITSRAYMKQSWKFLQYEQIFSTVQQNLWNSPFTMAIRCPGYGDVTWIEPMVVINSQRNRTFDGCTVMYGNQSVSKISLKKSPYRQMLSMLNLCVHGMRWWFRMIRYDQPLEIRALPGTEQWLFIRG